MTRRLDPARPNDDTMSDACRAVLSTMRNELHFLSGIRNETNRRIRTARITLRWLESRVLLNKAPQSRSSVSPMSRQSEGHLKKKSHLRSDRKAVYPFASSADNRQPSGGILLLPEEE